MPQRRRSALRLAAALVTLAFAGPAAAAWPDDRPIEVIVPFPPAGGVDAMVRTAVHHAARHLPGARFVVTLTAVERAQTSTTTGSTIGRRLSRS